MGDRGASARARARWGRRLRHAVATLNEMSVIGSLPLPDVVMYNVSVSLMCLDVLQVPVWASAARSTA